MSASAHDDYIHVFVPGRICLFGEHSDWAGTYRRFNSKVVEGYALVCGTRQGVFSRVKPHQHLLKMKSRLNNGEVVSFECEMIPEKLLKLASEGGFWSYVCGVAYEVSTNYNVRGIEIDNYKTDLPIKKGLSSSAALCVMVTRAFNRVYDLKLSIRGEMDVAYHGEIRTPSRCGRLDQCCAFGNTIVAMTFDGDMLGTREVRVSEEIYLVLVDLHGAKDTKRILSSLNKCYPFAETEVDLNVHRLLGPMNKATVLKAIEAIESGKDTAMAIGTLMVSAQKDFDMYATPACPEELTAPILHKILCYEPVQKYIHGGKGVGSQGDGTAQVIAKSLADQEALIGVLEKDLGVSCLRLTLGSGVSVRKAVIPAAGSATNQLFPASKCITPAMFPVRDVDGMLKPAILILVEEALEAGIQSIGVIVAPNDLSDFERLFHRRLSPKEMNSLSDDHQEYSNKILEMGKHVEFVVQEDREGFGHAVSCAAEFVDDEPFLLMLGDHLYRSFEHRSCTRQMLDAYHRNKGVNMVAIHTVDAEHISRVGVVSGHWSSEAADLLEHKADSPAGRSPRLRILNISAIVEKPRLQFAREKLQVPGTKQDEFYGMFGHYVLSPRIFKYLKESIDHNARVNGFFPLTTVLERVRREDRIAGFVVNGKRFDIGTGNEFVDTLTSFDKPLY